MKTYLPIIHWLQKNAMDVDKVFDHAIVNYTRSMAICAEGISPRSSRRKAELFWVRYYLQSVTPNLQPLALNKANVLKNLAERYPHIFAQYCTDEYAVKPVLVPVIPTLPDKVQRQHELINKHILKVAPLSKLDSELTEKTRRAILNNYVDNNKQLMKIPCIKEVREIYGIGLKDAKDLVDAVGYEVIHIEKSQI